jgi:hypothetical protein
MTVGNDAFWWFGFALSAVLGLFMLVPFWRRRSDALTAWNLILLGSIIFIGVGCMEVYAHRMHWPELKWFDANNHEIRWVFLATIVFYSALLFFYYKVRFPDRLLQNRLSKWPELSTGVMMVVLGICLGVSALMPFVARITFVREIALNFSHSALSIAVTFATAYWLKNRVSPFALALLLLCFGVAAVESMVAFQGRRLLLTVAFGPLVACYWLSWRYWSRVKLTALFGALALGLMIVAAFYSTFRHMKGERTASSVIQKAKSVSVEDIKSQLSDVYHYLAQYTVHYSLLTIRLTDEGKLQERPLDSIREIISYPIPRRLWPEKPRDLGVYIVTDTLHLPYKTNWGVGIVGQGYHDGGLVVLVLYAFLVTVLAKFIDVPLSRQPDNPFLLAALASSSAHLVALMRGGLAAMTINVLESIFFVLALAVLCRAIFGTARSYVAPGSFGWRTSAYLPPQ